MLKAAREHAGLGRPPTPYYNNIPESINAVIKRGVHFKETEMTKFCQEMSVLLMRQKQDVESAIINHGPYRLAAKFSHLEVAQDDWFRKNSTQKEASVKKFRSAKVSNSGDGNTTLTTSTVASTQNPCQRSFDLLNAGITSVDPTILQHMSQKVERLLNKENAIVPAPGSVDNSAFLVESDTSTRPHYVTIAKNGKVSCSDCPSWKARNLCAHSLVTAEKLGITEKFLKWFKTKGLKKINLTALVTCDSAKGVGKKGKKATGVRKGGRNAGKAPPTVVVDRIRFRAEPLSNVVTTSSVPAMFTPQPCSAQAPLRPNYYYYYYYYYYYLKVFKHGSLSQ